MRIEAARVRGQRTFGCGAALLTGLGVISAVAVIASAIFLLTPDRGGAAASFLASQPGSRNWNTEDQLNLLLLGTAGNSPQPARTPAMTLVSYSPQSNRLAVLSIPGNLWVTIPGYGQGRIADAYADGGARLALLTAESVTHIPIPYYAAAGYDAFTRIVDAFGGISVTVHGTIRLATSPTGGPARTLPAGVQRMDGPTALAYARLGAGTREYAPALQRQQQVLLALRHVGLRPDSLFRIPTILSALGASIATNFPYRQVPSLAHALSTVPNSHIHLARLDSGSGAVSSYGGGGTDVLLPNWDRIRVLAQRLIGPPAPGGAGPVEVLNGDGIAGEAQSVAGWLRQAAVPIRGYASASSFNHATTQVKVDRRAGVPTMRLARAVAALLQVPLVAAPSHRQAPIVVIIGRDYQDLTQQ